GRARCVGYQAVELTRGPKEERPGGQGGLRATLFPGVTALSGGRLGTVAKALVHPIRVQLVDVLRRHAGEVCVCELVPLFDVSQPTLSHHLKKLREAGIVGVERRGLWAYYYVAPDALEEMSTWLA